MLFYEGNFTDLLWVHFFPVRLCHAFSWLLLPAPPPHLLTRRLQPWRSLLHLPLRPAQVISVPGEGRCLGDPPQHWPWPLEPNIPRDACSFSGSWKSAKCQKGGSPKVFLPGSTSYCTLQRPFLMNLSPGPLLSLLTLRKEPNLSASVKLTHLPQGFVSSTATFSGPQDPRNEKAQFHLHLKSLTSDQGNFKGPAHSTASGLVTGPLSASPLS